MRYPQKRLRIRALFAAIAAAIPAVFIFWLTNRRVTGISLLFLRLELRRSAYGLSLLFTIIILIGILLWIALIQIHGFSKTLTLLHGTLSWIAFKALHRYALLTLALGTMFVFILLLFAQMRYRIFSETHYPLLAKHLFAEGRTEEARVVCERYVQLYPQRGPKGAARDSVCASIIELAEGSGKLYRYIKEQRPTPYHDGDIETPVGWDAKKRSLEILEAWAGGRTDS